MKPPKLKFHEKSCSNCRYYRIHLGEYTTTTDCLLLGRMLSIGMSETYLDMHRYCDGWKRRPRTWDVRCKENPYWKDKYIPRKTQINLRKRLGIRIRK